MYDDRIPAEERFGRYAILGELARGGMARVFVAQKDGSKDAVVLKHLHVELETHEASVKRIRREANVASQLDHPSIARITDAGVEDDRFFVAMEYVPGQNVEAILRALAAKGRTLPFAASMVIAKAVLGALEYAHSARDAEGRPLDLVHRDLSPRNVMVSFAGEVKIIDFGLARAVVDDFETAPGTIVGTLRYMSPEQAAAEPIDRRSDLYSVGAMLYELFTGQPLIAPGTPPIEVLRAIEHTRFPPASAINATLPPAIDLVLATALAKKASDRFQEATQFVDTLVAAAATLPRADARGLGALVRELFPEEQRVAEELIQRAAGLGSVEVVTRTAMRPIGAGAGGDWGGPFAGEGAIGTPEHERVAREDHRRSLADERSAGVHEHNRGERHDHRHSLADERPAGVHEHNRGERHDHRRSLADGRPAGVHELDNVAREDRPPSLVGGLRHPWLLAAAVAFAALLVALAATKVIENRARTSDVEVTSAKDHPRASPAGPARPPTARREAESPWNPLAPAITAENDSESRKPPEGIPSKAAPRLNERPWEARPPRRTAPAVLSSREPARDGSARDDTRSQPSSRASELARRLKRLEREWVPELFAATLEDLRAEARKLTPDAARAVEAELDRAERTESPEQQLPLLESALAKIREATAR